MGGNIDSVRDRCWLDEQQRRGGAVSQIPYRRESQAQPLFALLSKHDSKPIDEDPDARSRRQDASLSDFVRLMLGVEGKAELAQTDVSGTLA